MYEDLTAESLSILEMQIEEGMLMNALWKRVFL
jgi:hypothetical protein